MFLTEQEILDTPHALERTCAYFAEKGETIKAFFAQHTQRKFAFFGCGSSYMLAKSAAALFQSLPGTAACAVPAGDYIVDPASWREAVRDSIVVTLSRSGRTSEIVRAAEHIKNTLGCPIVSVSMQAENDVSHLCDLDLALDWCYDRSVCQTRTVTNLYTATLLLAAAYAGDGALKAAVHAATDTSADFQVKNRPALERLAALDWNNVVVLADGPVCGIAEEGALAFTEICMLCGRYFHLLDYRHGPIVISDEKTLTVILLNPAEEELQGAMVRDVMSHRGPVMTVSAQGGNPYGAAEHVQVEGVGAFPAWGIPFIYLAQMLSLLKSAAMGGNPDAPKGLDAYITLK